MFRSKEGENLKRGGLQYPVNPYHYILHIIGAKWKMTILHNTHAFDSMRFNETVKNLGISEKVLSSELKELVDDGLLQRIQYEVIPPKTEYFLTQTGQELIEILDLLYIWSVRRLDELGLPIDPDAFYSHQDEKYRQQLKGIMDKAEWQSPTRARKLWPEEWQRMKKDEKEKK